MPKLIRTVAVLGLVGLGAAGILSADEVAKPFPQAGAIVPSTFSPLVINGNWKDMDGKPVERHHSVVTHFGLKPVVLVLARDPKDDAVFELLKKLEARVQANKDIYLGAAGIFLCHDDKRGKADADTKELLKIAKERESIIEDLKEKVKTRGIKDVLVGIDAPGGPRGFAIAPKADVIVIVYNKFRVASAFSFERGGLDEKATASVLGALDRMAAQIKKDKPPTKQ